jgi:hypothetical protein
VIDAAKSEMVVFAIVYLLAFLGSCLFVWRAVRRLWRFLRICRRTTVKSAFRRSRQAAHRQAFRCATDDVYYLSRLTLLFSANLLAVTAVVFASIGVVAKPGPTFGLAANAWPWIANLLLLLFVMFAVRAFYRTARLSRQVMEIRRRLRKAKPLKAGVSSSSPSAGR